MPSLIALAPLLVGAAWMLDFSSSNEDEGEAPDLLSDFSDLNTMT